jgi:hypothetical protein
MTLSFNNIKLPHDYSTTISGLCCGRRCLLYDKILRKFVASYLD